jgi:hypothetical protein
VHPKTTSKCGKVDNNLHLCFYNASSFPSRVRSTALRIIRAEDIRHWSLT